MAAEQFPTGKRHLEPIFEQFRCDVWACVKDAQDQHPLTLDGKGSAEGTPVANNPQPRHDLDPLGAPPWKSRQAETMVADTRNEIPGDRRRRTSGYIVVELLQLGFRLGVEDNLVLHPLL